MLHMIEKHVCTLEPLLSLSCTYDTYDTHVYSILYIKNFIFLYKHIEERYKFIIILLLKKIHIYRIYHMCISTVIRFSRRIGIF